MTLIGTPRNTRTGRRKAIEKRDTVCEICKVNESFQVYLGYSICKDCHQRVCRIIVQQGVSSNQALDILIGFNSAD